MAQFYAEIQGNRGEATRMGTKASGVRGHIRGWNVGATVELTHTDGEDICIVMPTGGSSRDDSNIIVRPFGNGLIIKKKKED